jgi:hypothetical protein
MKRQHSSESGQSIVLVALGMIVMLGFLGLAVDGGRLYTKTRHAQNAADGAAMAAAAALCNNQEDPSPFEVAKEAAGMVGYDDNTIDNVVGVDVNPVKEQVEVTIWSEIPAGIAQIVYSGGLQTTVRAVGKCFSGGTPSAFENLPFGIISLSTSCSGASSASLGATGGGNEGGIVTYNSHMFVNVSSDPGCAINPPNGTNAPGIHADGDYCIFTVGSHNYSGSSNLDDCVISVPGGSISDPLAQAPVPLCTQNGATTTPAPGYNYAPGNWNGSALGHGKFQPGIYCISGTFKPSGNGVINATDGVVFYFVNGGLELTGQSVLKIVAPSQETCSGSSGSAAASCTFKGMALFMARNNASEIEVGGNAENRIVGTVYGASGTFKGNGGGNTAEDALIWGQVIMNHVIVHGNGNLSVWYDENISYIVPPSLGLIE